MNRRNLISALVFLGVMVGSTQVSPALAHAPDSGTELELLIPLYSYPTWWDPDTYLWDEIAEANSQIPTTVIVNPHSGPGGDCPNADYHEGLKALRDAGVTMLGYVFTDYARRDMERAKGEIDQYNNPCFDIDGIFLDGVSNKVSNIGYYQELCTHVRSLPNLDYVFLNPGTSADELYLTVGDTIVIFEDYSINWPAYQPDDHVEAYPAQRFAMLGHTLLDTECLETFMDLAVDRNIGYVYLTDDTMPNPWDTLPSFFDALLTAMAPNSSIPTEDPPYPNPVPEPAAVFPFGVGLIGVFVFTRRKVVGLCIVHRRHRAPTRG